MAGLRIVGRLAPAASLVALSLSLMAGHALAQTSAAASGSAMSSTRSSLAKPDQRFITDAAAAGMYEVSASKLAMERARSEDLKAYAKHLVSDHEQANAELTALAKQKGVPVGPGPTAAQQSQLDRMNQLQGNAFDTAYVQAVGIKAHREDIVLFEKTSKTSKDAELKAFATKTLPTLREHLATAQGIPAKASARLQDPIASAPRP
jgi:putative membrane protein